MPPQVIRLALAFGVVIAGFLTFKAFATPDGFGTQGFHRVQAGPLVASRDMAFAGRDACLECHQDLADHTTHFKAKVGCESCHGPAKKHADDFESFKPPKPTSREDCARCHDMIIGRPDRQPQVPVKEHNPGEQCITCHTIHEEASK
jgi:hypothetical protein